MSRSFNHLDTKIGFLQDVSVLVCKMTARCSVNEQNGFIVTFRIPRFPFVSLFLIALFAVPELAAWIFGKVLIPILASIFKVLERLLFASLYSYLIDNKSITCKQSGFIKWDSITNPHLSLTHMIHPAFKCDIPKEVISVYLDISKAFDKVWHKGSIFKLIQTGINGRMLNILTDLLSSRV